jgi:hypothetical protein
MQKHFNKVNQQNFEVKNCLEKYLIVITTVCERNLLTIATTI